MLKSRIMLIAPFILALGTAQADGIAKYEVSEEKPTTVILKRFNRSLIETMFESNATWDFTLHEYSGSDGKSMDSTVTTTGASLTLRVKEGSVQTNIATGGGDQFELPINLYLHGLKVSESSIKPYDPTKDISFRLKSADTRDPRPYLGELVPSAKVLENALARGPLNSSDLRSLSSSSVGYSGEEVCGFKAMRDGLAYVSVNVNQSRPKPLDIANLLVSFTNGKVEQVVSCNPAASKPICVKAGLFHGWAKYTFTFRFDQLCNVRDIETSILDWAENKIVKETKRPTLNQ